MTVSSGSDDDDDDDDADDDDDDDDKMARGSTPKSHQAVMKVSSGSFEAKTLSTLSRFLT